MGGVLIAIADLIAFLSGVYADTSSRGAVDFVALVVLLGVVLVLLGLLGLYVSQAEVSGVLGLIGFLFAFLGMTMIAGLYWAYAFVVPPLEPVPEGLILTFLLSALGWLMFGAAMLRGHVYPRPAVIVLMIGAVLSTIPLPATEIVLVVAIAWLGYYLFSGQGTATAQTPPRVS